MAMLAASTFFTSSPGLAAEKENVCWPLHFAEVTLGISTDPQVTRLIGKGIFRKDEGDTGGRVFVDKAPQTARRLAQSRSGPPGPDKQEKCVNEVISGSPKKRDKYAHKIIPA